MFFFFPLLISFSYQLRIECMLICEETQILLQCLWPKAQAIRTACESKCITDVSMARAQSREASISNIDAIRNGINDFIGYDLIKINLLIAENVVNNQNNRFFPLEFTQ